MFSSYWIPIELETYIYIEKREILHQNWVICLTLSNHKNELSSGPEQTIYINIWDNKSAFLMIVAMSYLHM